MLILLALSGCRHEVLVVEGATEMEPRVCIPEEQSWETISPGQPLGKRLGASVAVLSLGSGPDSLGADGILERDNRNAYRLIAAGAPGLDSDGALGYVEVWEASTSDGELQGSSASMSTTLQMPSGHAYSGWQFGAALETADVAECAIGLIWGGGTYDVRCGQELMVGVPASNPGTEAGVVVWYEQTNSPASNVVLTYGGIIEDPMLSVGGGFGAAITASKSAWNEELQNAWLVAGRYPSWIAIGAPGDERVEVFSVDETNMTGVGGSAAPFTHLMTLSNPNSWKPGFGSVIISDDFNGDQIPDLAVGAPDAPDGGMVWVYRGTSTGLTSIPYPLGNSGSHDGFGAALATGRAKTGAIRSHLFVGAPLYGDSTTPEQGEICQYTLNSQSSPPSGLGILESACISNPDGIANEHFGAALAVGNFGAVDANGSWVSNAANVRDLAVGRPGYNGGDGRVSVYYSGVDGIAFDDGTGGVELTLLSELQPSAAGGGSEYGSALSSGYVQERLWGDVVVGAPDYNSRDGLVALSRANSVSGACGDLTGAWDLSYVNQAGDSATAAVEIQRDDLTGNARLVFNERVHLILEDDDGDICTTEYGYDGEGEDDRGWIRVLFDNFVLLAIGGEEDYFEESSTFWIRRGNALDLGKACGTAFDGVDTWTFNNVPLSPLFETILGGFEVVMPADDFAAIQALTGDVLVHLTGGPGSTVGTIELIVPWDQLWEHTNVTVELSGTNPITENEVTFDYTHNVGFEDCETLSPSVFDVVQTRGGVCED